MIVAMTGVSGNMGREVLRQTMELSDVRVRVLLSNKKANDKLSKKLKKQYGDRVSVYRGTVADRELCKQFVKGGVDLVVHMAAVIPPKSDKSFKESYESNLLGTVALTDAIKQCSPQPKFIHISTVALYGNRNELHPWARVGDPLLVSPFDAYAMHKLFAERYVLESELDAWVVLRQTAMLYPEMMSANISDGLMFHTASNAPLEWTTSRDSGLLIKNIIDSEMKGEIPSFWKKIYNIGAGKRGRETGYDTFNDGFQMIGGNTEKFFKPRWFAQRNFHGVWFSDSNELEELFHYQRDGVKEYWQEIANAHKLFRLGKIVPRGLIHLFLFRKLLYHENSPYRWLKDGDAARVQAYYGGKERIEAIPSSWDRVKLLARGDFGDYDKMREDGYAKANGLLLSHGYDESKPFEEWDIEDMKSAASFRGGECVSEHMDKGAIHKKLVWKCCEGHTFESSPYTVLRGGHWCPFCCQSSPWQFDRLAKKMPFFAQVWYDSHDREENFLYDIDESGRDVVREDTP